MSDWKPGTKVPKSGDLERMVFVRNHGSQTWIGPVKLKGTLSVDDVTAWYAVDGGGEFREAVLAEPVERDQEDGMTFEEYKERNKEAFDALRDAIGKALYSMTPEERRRLSFMSICSEDAKSKPTTGHPAAPKLREIVDDLARDGEAWREWDCWNGVRDQWIPAVSEGHLFAVAAKRPDLVRRRQRPHRAEWVRKITCRECGAIAYYPPELSSERTCVHCGHTASIEEK